MIELHARKYAFSAVLSVIIVLTLSSFNVIASYKPGFDGQYRATSYLLDEPVSHEYGITCYAGGTAQTYYGIFANVTLEKLSDTGFSGVNNEGCSISIKFLDYETYYDQQEKRISHSSKHVITINDEVRSTTIRDEFGRYNGNYATVNDILSAQIGDVFTYSYEKRHYENGNYKETSQVTRQILIKDFPTRVVEAGTYSTVHVEVVESANGPQVSKDDKYYSMESGKIVYLESFQQEDSAWSPLARRE